MGGRCTIRNEENMKKKTVAVCMANIDEQYNDIFLHRFREFAAENDINLLYFYSFSAFYFMDSHDIGERKIYLSLIHI